MRPNLVKASFALYGLKSWPRSTPQDRICEMLYFSYLQSFYRSVALYLVRGCSRREVVF